MKNGVVIQAENIRKSYGRKEVLKGANLTVRAGQVYALLGNNGVGKSTLIKSIAGQLRPDEGSVRVFGLDPIRDGVAVKQRTAYVSELMKVPAWMTLQDLIDFVRGFYPGWNEELCRELVEKFGLPLDRKMTGFSRGMYAKGVLLAAFCREPDLLILDDPCLGLDTGSRQNFMEMLIGSLESYEKTVLLSTHIIPEIAGVADHLGILVDGRIAVEIETQLLQEEMRLLTLASEEAGRLPELPLISRRSSGVEELLAVRMTEDRLRQELQTAGLSRFQLRPLSLEEIFLEYTR